MADKFFQLKRRAQFPVESVLIMDIPGDQKELKRMFKKWDIPPNIRDALMFFLKDGDIAFLCLSRTKGKGYPKCEVCVKLPDGSVWLCILKQITLQGDRYGALHHEGTFLSPEVMDAGKKKRNSYIAELYKETKLTQVFLAHLFHLSQSRISKILEKQGVKHPKR